MYVSQLHKCSIWKQMKFGKTLFTAMGILTLPLKKCANRYRRELDNESDRYRVVCNAQDLFLKFVWRKLQSQWLLMCHVRQARGEFVQAMRRAARDCGVALIKDGSGRARVAEFARVVCTSLETSMCGRSGNERQPTQDFASCPLPGETPENPTML